MKLHIIANIKSGTFRKKKLKQLCLLLKKKDIQYNIHYTEYEGHAEVIVKSINFSHNDRLLVCGGDGALSEAVNGLNGRDVTVGIFPMGTVNVVANFLNMPRNPDKFLETVLNSKIQEMYPGKAGDKYFVFSSSVGLDSFALANVSLKLKSMIGRFAYGISFFKDININRKKKISIKIDNADPVSCFGVVVGKLKCYAGKGVLFEKAEPLNNNYQVCYFTDNSLPKMFLSFIMIVAGLAKYCPWLKFLEGEHIEVSADSPLPLQIDGDCKGETPVVFSPAERSIKMICA